MSSEVEYRGVKIRGGKLKLLILLPLLGTIAGSIWAGFEGYARWIQMEEKINEYVAPDLTTFTVKLDVLEERLTSLEETNNVEIRTVKELVGSAQSDARTIRIDLRKDINEVQDQIAGVDKRSRDMNTDVRSSLRQTETDLRTMIDHASDRFGSKRTAIEQDGQRRIETIDTKLTELEERLRTMLERALNNPLAGQ
tara:strand:+ start:509 stop:1096 length:588 start_codon:yes stop_codon:yes gene_type:complete